MIKSNLLIPEMIVQILIVIAMVIKRQDRQHNQAGQVNFTIRHRFVLLYRAMLMFQ